MSRPSLTDDGWWLAVLWVAEPDGIVSFVELAPAAGPSPDPPLSRVGPAMAGGMSGLIAEEAGRLAIRLATVAQPEHPDRPWRTPALVRAAIRFEPVRAATMRDSELAEAVVEAFRRAVASLAPA